ncbi:RlpA-like double-psi beta-barrel domain-containing protein, partial [Patescibacteria group bacterium]
WPVPEGAHIVSNFYQFDFLRMGENSDPLILPKPYTLALKYQGDNSKLKIIRYFDRNSGAWIPLPSTTDFTNGYVRAITHLPFSRVAVFEEDTMQEGRASYYVHYKYPGQLIAASRDYPFGTELKVENLENGKSVVVTVRDYGPNQEKHPDRIVDISKTAFSALGPLSRGTLPVRVTPFRPTVLGVSTETAELPNITSKAAIAIDARTGEILYSKNIHGVYPIASLTKVMTANIFLETHTSWDAIVTYDAMDNAIGAKLNVNPGETMTARDLFFTSLVGSANNATNALARSTGLSTEVFLATMNNRAREWGLTRTFFEDVTGLSENNKSTAWEYAELTRHAFEHFDLLVGTTTPAYGFRTINTDIPHTITSKNKILPTDWYVTGTKTGFTYEALYTLMTKVRDRDTENEVITVILGAQDDATRYRETNELLDYSFSKI